MPSDSDEERASVGTLEFSPAEGSDEHELNPDDDSPSSSGEFERESPRRSATPQPAYGLVIGLSILVFLLATAVCLLAWRSGLGGLGGPRPQQVLGKYPEGHYKPTGITTPLAGAIGWDATDEAVGQEHWCQIGVPAETWSARQLVKPCSAAPNGQVNVKALSYNLFWWNLFDKRQGNDGSAGKLIADSSQDAPFDVMGFQECNDVKRVLDDAKAAGMQGEYRTLGPVDPITGAVAIAWLDSTWKALLFGIEAVAEDEAKEWWGARHVAWVRLSHRKTGETVLFMNHHGPLPISNPGGLCGAQATAYHLLRVIGYHVKPGESVILLGDFNANSTSATVTRLSRFLDHPYHGQAYGGVDNFFSLCTTVTDRKNLGPGGSDHDALSVNFRIP
mmetsp:Transcript_8199/g.24123  ORF Transcript_8199/g.24123 Transcript_8199/m.24123 type:complete len:390 (-) Transcript_8199:66-1235(-)